MPAETAKPPVSTADQSRIGEILQWTPTTLFETDNEGHRIVIGGGGPEGGTPSTVGIRVLREWVIGHGEVHHQELEVGT
jgi:hypothetical protein